LAGYDRHLASHQALEVAADLAWTLGAALVVLHVIDLHDYPIDPDRADWEAEAERTIASERRAAERLLRGAYIEWTYVTARAQPAPALAKLAQDIDAMFIVVGASGRGVAHHLLHGSVPQALARKQPRPVLVVPAPPKQDPDGGSRGGLHLAAL
jgi:nucleotide-binding universal stress UspA family protein